MASATAIWNQAVAQSNKPDLEKPQFYPPSAKRRKVVSQNGGQPQRQDVQQHCVQQEEAHSRANQRQPDQQRPQQQSEYQQYEAHQHGPPTGSSYPVEQMCSAMFSAMAGQTTTTDSTIKFDLDALSRKNRYHSGQSQWGVLQKNANKGAYHEFTPADFTKNYLPKIYPEIYGQLVHRLSLMPGCSKDNCLKATHFDPRIVGFPRIMLDMILEYSVFSMEKSGRLSAEQVLCEVLKCHREFDMLCVRYSKDVQVIAVQRFGDKMVAEKNSIDPVRAMKEAVAEVTAFKPMAYGFDALLWNGFVGSCTNGRGGNGRNNTRRNNSRGFSGNNGHHRSSGGGHSGGNNRSNSGRGNSSYGPPAAGNAAWNNPESDQFIPRGWCKQHFGNGNCHMQNCRFSHVRWTTAELNAAKERMRGGRNN